MATKLVSVHEAKTHLSRLLQQVISGETIVIARSGRPVARLVPIERPMTARSPGNDDVRMHADFDEVPPTIRRAFGLPAGKRRRGR
ncbi:MAG: type II toxin-antitoxin system prevent-host-death family antitoxin [Deltaproteobacteria bacterium]|nr:type II toxin-antitoxin system prevent-host-death family antitoxin [Deltaproteobacteria bacterium]